MMDIIAYIILVGLVIYLAYLNVSIRLKLKKLDADYSQVVLDYAMFKTEYNRLSDELNKAKVEKDDGFVRFLSESRDWAFQYIESTQAVIAIFDSELKAILDSEDKPAQKVAKIKQAHKDLLAILPEKP